MSPIRLVGQTDAQLVEAARAGDGLAFGTLYERHAARVAAVCRKRVAPHEVDDIVQEAFVRAHDRLEQLEDPDAFGGWVRAIAARACIDLHRRRRAVPTDDFADVSDGAAGLDERLIAHEDAAAVHAHLATLGERDRRALWLRDAMETPIAAIAAEMGTTEGSTRVLLARARKRLRAAYVAVVGWLVGLRAAGRRRSAELGDVAVAAAATGIVAAQVTASLFGLSPQRPTGELPRAVQAAPQAAVDAGTRSSSRAAEGAIVLADADAAPHGPVADMHPEAPAPVADDVRVDVDQRSVDPDAEPDLALELGDQEDESWVGVELTSGAVELLSALDPRDDGDESDPGGHDTTADGATYCPVFCPSNG